MLIKMNILTLCQNRYRYNINMSVDDKITNWGLSMYIGREHIYTLRLGYSSR